METTHKKKTFSEIIRSEPLVLVDFFTEWCGPCKMMKPILEEVQASVGDKLKILKVDVDKNPQAGAAFQIRGVPTLVLFKKGNIVWRQSGVVPVSVLRNLVHEHRAQ